jgi:hypothetical protein
MDFTHEDLGALPGGAKVIVGFEGTDADVLLLNRAQFARYRAGGLLVGFVGGHYRHSPVRLDVPYEGRWHVVVDSDEHVEAWTVDVILLAA